MKRLDPKINIKHKPVITRKKTITEVPELATLSLIKLMITQGKIFQAKKNLRLVINHSKNKKEQQKAKNILSNL